jgi:hypothetical protein
MILRGGYFQDDAIADKYGYTLTTEEVTKLQIEADFLNLVEQVLDRDK